ncbi:hypothetical protein D9619_000622 [Psilocybe cf. subviscida]|uniref:non-specific serine/threonine protein kinase n=1 Tax=Psilocybe cf. subviscida TaxID=2480587 RepID=A0A8H5F447_9AGAR|nr:hypothetical protein D9619_000622 [Psilocybe cf. subviscida]
MLGIRTKQINTYGKRGRRVVDVSSATSAAPVSSETLSVFDGAPPPSRFTPLSSTTTKRENLVPSKAKPSLISVKSVGLQKKKRLAPVLSPPKKTRVAQLINAEAVKAKPPAKRKPLPPSEAEDPESPIEIPISPPRKPLTSYTLNIPGSPINPPKRVALKKAPTTKSKKPFAPFVDVDIIVLDNDGKTVSKERRVSRSNVDANPSPPPKKAKKPLAKAHSKIVDSDSEVEVLASPLNRPKRTVSRKAVIILDDSDSASDVEASTPVKQSKSVIAQAKSRPKSQIEVVIPPAPYKIPRPTQVAPPPPRIPTPARPVSPVAEISQHPSLVSPPLKPRQLTPIRGNRRALFAPPSPPSPTTPSDFDLSLDFDDLSLSDTLQTQGTYPYQSDFQVPEYLLPLLDECGQENCGPHNFSTFIESFPCDPILRSARAHETSDLRFRKIGEASYSEVFGIGDVVLKVIPLRDETKTDTCIDEEEGPAPSDAKDVRKEIVVTRAMGDVYGGFVKLLKTYVVRGRYPEVLLQLWDEYNERKGSESVRPDTFKVSQVYAIIVLPNGGPDLEAYTFQSPSKTGWRQACSLFWQVAKALSHAEALVSFEHRDLHWGQILVKNTPTQGALKQLDLNHKLQSKSRRVYMDDLSHGVEATVIDLGLSRMDAGDGTGGNEIHWTPFDEEVFMGEGDYQFDIYRIMKNLTGAAWQSFHPVTNVLWLHYLLQKLIHSKGIKPPAAARKLKASSEPAAVPLSKEVTYSEKDCYDCLLDIENWLGDAIAEIAAAPKAAVKGKGKQRKTEAPAPGKRPAFNGPARAGEIVAYGVKKGWIKPTVMT